MPWQLSDVCGSTWRLLDIPANHSKNAKAAQSVGHVAAATQRLSALRQAAEFESLSQQQLTLAPELPLEVIMPQVKYTITKNNLSAGVQGSQPWQGIYHLEQEYQRTAYSTAEGILKREWPLQTSKLLFHTSEKHIHTFKSHCLSFHSLLYSNISPMCSLFFIKPTVKQTKGVQHKTESYSVFNSIPSPASYLHRGKS